MRCQNCGTQLDDDERFCHQCGMAVTKLNEGPVSIKRKRMKWPFVLAVALVIFVAAVVLIAVFVSGSRNKRYEDHLRMAEHYLDKLDYDRAILEYNEAIEIDPKRTDAYLELCDIYLLQGDKDAAIETLEDGIRKCGDDGKKRLKKKMKRVESETEDSSETTITPTAVPTETPTEQPVAAPTEAPAATPTEIISEENYTDWKEAYSEFILNEEYKEPLEYYPENFGSDRPDFGNEAAIKYLIYDMDADGVPELIMNNGYDGRALRCCYAFTFHENEIKYIRICPTDAFLSSDPAYPGIFGSYNDTGNEHWSYYEKKGLCVYSNEICEREYGADGSMVVTSLYNGFTKEEAENVLKDVTLIRQYYSYEDVAAGKIKAL